LAPPLYRAALPQPINGLLELKKGPRLDPDPLRAGLEKLHAVEGVVPAVQEGELPVKARVALVEILEGRPHLSKFHVDVGLTDVEEQVIGAWRVASAFGVLGQKLTKGLTAGLQGQRAAERASGLGQWFRARSVAPEALEASS
jgi:hypothetical protein